MSTTKAEEIAARLAALSKRQTVTTVELRPFADENGMVVWAAPAWLRRPAPRPDHPPSQALSVPPPQHPRRPGHRRNPGFRTFLIPPEPG